MYIVDAACENRFNFLDWESKRSPQALTLNITALLSEVAKAYARGAGRAEDGHTDDKFWENALDHLLGNLIDLCVLSKQTITLPLLREISNSAPQTLEEANSEGWRSKSKCYDALKLASAASKDGDEYTRVNLKECIAYWLQEFPNLSDKTRSIIVYNLSMLTRPFLTMPLYRLFCTDTNIQPEDMFSGKIIIIDLPVQTFRHIGLFSALIWKYCARTAILSRSQPTNGTHLRPRSMVFMRGGMNACAASHGRPRALASAGLKSWDFRSYSSTASSTPSPASLPGPLSSTASTRGSGHS
jgi:hypothetical protein